MMGACHKVESGGGSPTVTRHALDPGEAALQTALRHVGLRELVPPLSYTRSS